MEKKSRKSIIVGITSLLLVMLLLVGLTYAYYRTRIIGNESTDPSISVTSKNMQITYQDGTAEMNMTGKIEPGFTASKTFYVKNTGNQDGVYSVILDEMTNDFDRNQDWQVTLTKNGTEVISADDNIYLAVGTHQVLLGSESIAAPTDDAESKDTYVLTVTYVNSEEDQSEDMGAELSFRVNISDEMYKWKDAPSGSLLYALKNNQPNGTEETIPGRETSTENEKRILTTEDDYGTSYVYRGAVTNNYVNYSGMCWRIVRVQGDGTIKIVLADEKGECDADTYLTSNSFAAFINGGKYYSYSSDKSVNGFIYANSNIPAELTAWINKEITDTEGTVIRSKNLDTSKLVTTDWCNDTSISRTESFGFDDKGNVVYTEKEATDGWHTDYYYGAYDRVQNKTTANPSLKCNMKGFNDSTALRYPSNIGLLTADEVAFAGGISDYVVNTYYLLENARDQYWLMSPNYFSALSNEVIIFRVYYDGALLDHSNILTNTVRPAVVLKSDVTIEDGGNGTQTNPYVIK